MNFVNTQTLLSQWEIVLAIAKDTSIKKIAAMPNGPLGRIKRTTGNPVIFDIEGFNEQRSIQTKLLNEIPQCAYIIRSTPPIMDGFAWTRQDFVDLYFDYYQFVIEKIRTIISSM